MTEDNLFVGDEATLKLRKGINKAVDAVKLTLGPKGRNSLIQTHEHPFNASTSDGITILEHMHFADPIENMGLNLVKENSGRHNKQSGDGSTSAAVVLQAILEEADKITDVAPVEIMDSLNETLPLVLKSLDEQTKQITVDEVGKIATVAARDEKIGALVQEIYKQIGKDGILYPDVSKTFEDSYTIGKGIKIEGAGLASPYMADVDDNQRFLNVANYKNPAILVTKQKINSASELNDISSRLFSRDRKELVIFCGEIEATQIVPLVMTKAKNGFKFLVIKLPVIFQDQWFEDIAKLTGSTLIDPAAGLKLAQVKLEHLGTCGNVLADKNDTFLEGVLDITDHVKAIETRGDDDSKIRAARLNTKTARLFIGAHSDQMLFYKRLRVEDARNSAYLALQSGIVAGGGLALMNASQSLPDTVGGRILKEALKAPLTQVLTNANVAYLLENGEVKIKEDTRNVILGGKNGYDAKKGKVTNMELAGIVDAASVVKSSVTNALSIASIVLTAPIIIPLQKQEVQMPNMPTV